MKLGFYTLGCKLNQAETSELKEKLAKDGFEIINNPKQADIVILAACGVTAGASQRTRQMIRAFKKQGAKIFVIGCLENKIPEVDFYSQDLYTALKSLRAIAKQSKASMGSPRFARDDSKVRAFVKIQTGCDFKCAFCLTRQLRGQSHSVDPQIIIEQIRQKMKHGAKEIVLTGINIGLYQSAEDFVRPHEILRTSKQIILLPNLVKMIFNQIRIKRLRFGSIDPRLVTNEFIKLFKNKRLCPHLHLSIQSGSDKILKTMRRNYTAEKCLEIIEKFHRLNPLFSFSADIIVGFPDETEKDFQKTCDFVHKAKLVKTHIFPFSARSGTEAAALPNQISTKIKKERSEALEEIAKISREQYLQSLIGKKRPALIEGKRRDLWEGYTPEFIRTGIKSKENLKGKIKNIVITKEKILP